MDEMPDFDNRSQWDDMGEVFAHMFNPEGDLEEQLQEYLEERSEEVEQIAFYQENGSFRNSEPLDPEEEQRIELIVDHQIPQQCYYNAQTGMIAADSGPDAMVRYVEGYTASPKAPAPTPHAWLEVNGKVAEITLPEGKEPGRIYYGVAYDAQTVRDAMMIREQADPLCEHPNEYTPLNDD